MKLIAMIAAATALLIGSALAAPPYSLKAKRQYICLSPDSCWDTCGSEVCCIDVSLLKPRFNYHCPVLELQLTCDD